LGCHWNLFSWSVAAKDDVLVEYLIDRGADVNGCYSAHPCTGYTALMLAAEKGNTNLIIKLMNKRVVVNSKDMGGRNAIQYAKDSGKTNIVEILERANKGAK